jgi:hypothetical protein
MGHDRDGEIRRQLADVFHLQPDRGFQFFARFCRFLQTSITAWGAERDHRLWLSERAHGLNSGREPLALRYRRRTQTAGGDPSSQRRCRDNVPTAPTICRRPQRAVGPFADGGSCSGSCSHLVGLLHTGHAFRIGYGAVIGIPLLPQLSSARCADSSRLPKVACERQVPVCIGRLTAAARVY